MKFTGAALAAWVMCVSHVVAASQMSGAGFDSLTSPAEATFVRACYLATGASLRGDETVSGMLTVLSIGQGALLSDQQRRGIREVVRNVRLRWLVLQKVRSR